MKYPITLGLPSASHGIWVCVSECKYIHHFQIKNRAIWSNMAVEAQLSKPKDAMP
jgi:hypothetical protein